MSEQELQTAIISLAGKHRLTIGTVESITGGRVASALTGVPGASTVVKGGVITYTDEIKHRVIGVSSTTLETVGAVSPECAAEMAAGGQKVLAVDIAIAITGFAGPAGPADNHPVGTVYYGLAIKDRPVKTVHCQHNGNRPEIQDAATAMALTLVLNYLKELEDE